MLKEWLVVITNYTGTVLDALALALVIVGTIEAVFGGLRVMFSSAASNQDKRDIWLRYARWLVGALTFQLAADIIETAIAPSWDDIGRLAVIAVIRTFLDFFLERDVAELRRRQRPKREGAA